MPQETIWAHYQNEGLAVFQGDKGRHNFLLKYAARMRPATVLNIGCGDGYIELEGLKRGWRVLSADPDERAMARLAERGAEARKGSIEALPFADGSADVVICTEVLEHLTGEQLAAGLPEIRRVLKSGGVLIGTTPYREDLKSNEFMCMHCGEKSHRWGHQQSFDEKQMKQLLGAWFTVREARPKYFPIWQTNWKGKLLNATLLAASVFGSYGQSANLFFVAAKP
jgi:SAM-dependent methyltransferase